MDIVDDNGEINISALVSIRNLGDAVDSLVKIAESNQNDIVLIKKSMINSADSLVKVFDNLKIKIDKMTIDIDKLRNKQD